MYPLAAYYNGVMYLSIITNVTIPLVIYHILYDIFFSNLNY